MTNSDVDIQRRYYAETAQQYDAMHVHEKDEHFFALRFLVSMLDYLEVNSILDVGSGTGRAVQFIKAQDPVRTVVGVEPVDALREIGYRQGLTPDELVPGDATRLRLDDGAFDLVCSFGMLHHIRKPELAVAEMLRVARKAIFISDSNNFGQGTVLVRTVKQALDRLGLWKLANLIKTRGRGYAITEGDGLAYSYSVFNNYRQIRRQCDSVHILNIMGSGINLYRTASHVALLGIKAQDEVC